MKMKISPDGCSSLNCQPPQGYCRDCSHANFDGQALVNGKVWRWEFNPWFGPLFLKKDGMPREVQPAERHPVWDAFQTWFEAWDKKHAKREKT